MEQQNHYYTQLTHYIAQNRAAGVADHDIRGALIHSGWPADMVDQSLAGPQQAQPHHGYEHAAAHQAQQPSRAQSQHPGGQVAHGGARPPKRKYKLFEAIPDGVKAIRTNIKTFLAACALSIIGVIVVTGLALAIIGPVFAKIFGLFGVESFLADRPGTGEVIALVLGLIIVVMAWYVCVTAFIFSTVATAVHDGAAGHKAGVKATLRRAFKQLPRLIVSNALTAAIMFLPIASLLVITIWRAVTSDGMGLMASYTLFPLVFAMAVAWIILCTLRFSLVPYVAMFEPHIPVLRTVGRGMDLLKDGGYWFVIKGFGLIFLIYILVSAATGVPLGDLDESQHPLVVFTNIVVGLFSVSTLVMLYRNQKAARG